MILPNEIYQKYRDYIIKYNSGEDIIHHSKLKECVIDLINNSFYIKDFDGFFYIPGKYTMCPVNLIKQIPSDYNKNINLIYYFIDDYIRIAKKDAEEDKNSMNDFYVEICYNFKRL